MRLAARFPFTLAAALLPFHACAESPPECPPASGVALQVLGSGGPIADDARASSGYLVWVDGRARVLIDVGSGTFQRLGEAHAAFEDLDFVGLSHFHTDHSADFVALLKSGNFSARERSLPVAGPGPGGGFPGLGQYLDSLLAPGSGAYAYLSGYLDGTRGLVKLDATEIDDVGTVEVHREGGLAIDASRVPHGIVPALGFRVSVEGTTIVFSSDQNGTDDRFVDFSRDADILVMHMPVPETAAGAALSLHAKPSALGRIASAANVDTLVLSHFMARSLRDIDKNVNAVRAAFDGRIVVARDLSCVLGAAETDSSSKPK